MKRIIALFLLFCLTFSLSACSLKNADNESMQQAEYSGGKIAGSDLTGSGGARVFNPKTISLPDANTRAVHAIKVGSEIFLYAQTDQINRFYSIHSDNTVEKIDIAIEGAIVSIDSDLSENIFILSMNSDGSYMLTQIRDSQEVDRRDLSFLSTVEDAIWGITVTESGYLVETPGNVLCYDLSGQYVKEFGPFHGAFSVIRNGSEICIAIGNDGQEEFRVIGSSFKETTTYKLPMELQGISGGALEGHCFATYSGIIYDIDFTNGTRVAYANSYMSGDGIDFIFLDEDSYFSILNGEARIYSLSDTTDTEEIRTIILATYAQEDYEIYDLLEAVRAFNEANTSYQIEIANYGMYDDLGGEKTGLQRLTTDILAGNTPDIYDLSVLPYLPFYKNGLLEDLYPFIQSSDTVSLDDLVPSVIHSLEYNGCLYSLVPSYTITTMYGPEALLGDTTWDTGAFIEIANSTDLYLFGPRMTKAEYLRYLLTFTGSEYIDTQRASCNFVNSSFPAMLSIASRLPDTYDGQNVSSDDWGLIYTGQQLFTVNSSPDLLAGLNFAKGAYSGNAVSLGFPSNNNGVAVNPYMNLGMSSTSNCKNGVWSFFEYLLSDAFQGNITLALPIKRAMVESRMDAWIANHSDMTDYKGWADNQIHTIPVTPITPALKEEAMAILLRADSVNYCDNTLYELVLKEAMPFFQGAITAEQAAQNIQSKASLYLAEQYG